MEKELKVVVAGGVGLLLVLGIIGLRRIFAKDQFSSDDDHCFDMQEYEEEDTHGIELYSVR